MNLYEITYYIENWIEKLLISAPDKETALKIASKECSDNVNNNSKRFWKIELINFKNKIWLIKIETITWDYSWIKIKKY